MLPGVKEFIMSNYNWSNVISKLLAYIDIETMGLVHSVKKAKQKKKRKKREKC